MHKTIVTFVLVIFMTNAVYTPLLKAEIVVPILSKPGTTVALSPAFIPAHLSGLIIHPENAFQLDFLIDQGDATLTEEEKNLEYNKLIKYFLAALTIPDADQWVNLSPYEKDRVIPDTFGQTRMGNDLLIQDYMLKQLSASLLHPEGAAGKKFWGKIYAQAAQVYGNVHVPVQTFNKVWIVPSKATLYEKGNAVYIVENYLKVMLEEDYLASQQSRAAVNETAERNLSQELMRSIILPELEREINTGKNFALLRQVYSGMLLATWFKRTLKQSLVSQVYANQSKIDGVHGDTERNQLIYEQYLQAFKKGAFNMIQDELASNGQTIPRKYFSGGTEGYKNTHIKKITSIDAAMSKEIQNKAVHTDVVAAVIKPVQGPSVKEIKRIVAHVPSAVPRSLSRLMLREQGQPVGGLAGRNSVKQDVLFENNSRMNREKRIEDNIHFSDVELEPFLGKQKEKALEKIAKLKENTKQGITVSQLSAANRGLVLAHQYDLVKGHKGLMFEEDYNRLGLNMPWKEFLKVISKVASASDKFVNFLSGVTPQDAQRVFGREHAVYYKAIEPFLPEEKDFQVTQALRTLVASKLGLVYEAFDETDESVRSVYTKNAFYMRIPAKTHTDQLQRKMYKVLVNLETALKAGRFNEADMLEVLPDFNVISEAFAQMMFLIMTMEEKLKNQKPILLRNNTINPGQSLYTLKNLYAYVRSNKSLPSYVVTLIKANMDIIEHEFHMKDPEQFAHLLFRFLKYAYDDKGSLRDALKGGMASDNPSYKSELLDANLKITFIPPVHVPERRIHENVVFTNDEIDPLWKEKSKYLSMIARMISNVESGLEDAPLLNADNHFILDYKFMLKNRRERVIERQHYMAFKSSYHLPMSWEDFTSMLTMTGYGKVLLSNKDAVYLTGIVTRKTLRIALERYQDKEQYLRFMMPYINEKADHEFKPELARMIAEHLGLTLSETQEHYLPVLGDQITLAKYFIVIPQGVRLEDLQRKILKVLFNLEQAVSSVLVREEVLEVMPGPRFEVVPKEFIQRVVDIARHEERLGNTKPLVFLINPINGSDKPMTLKNYYTYTQGRDVIDFRRDIFAKNEDSVQGEFVRTVRVVKQYLPIVLSHIFDKNLELKDPFKTGDARTAPLNKSEIFDAAMMQQNKMRSIFVMVAIAMAFPMFEEYREFNQVRIWQGQVMLLKSEIESLELRLLEIKTRNGIDAARKLLMTERAKLESRIKEIPLSSKAHSISINGKRVELMKMLQEIENRLNLSHVTPGGIDLNQNGLDLQISREENVSMFKFNNDAVSLSNFQGFEPYILNIKPAITLPIFSQ